MYSRNKFSLLLIFLIFVNLNYVYSTNKYSREANVKPSDHFDDDSQLLIRDKNKPFRMAKLNLLWSKAKLVNRILLQIEDFHIVLHSSITTRRMIIVSETFRTEARIILFNFETTR